MCLNYKGTAYHWSVLPLGRLWTAHTMINVTHYFVGCFSRSTAAEWRARANTAIKSALSQVSHYKGVYVTLKFHRLQNTMFFMSRHDLMIIQSAFNARMLNLTMWSIGSRESLDTMAPAVSTELVSFCRIKFCTHSTSNTPPIFSYFFEVYLWKPLFAKFASSASVVIPRTLAFDTVFFGMPFLGWEWL